MELITKYFPGLSGKQLQQFRQLEQLFRDWNAKVNLISRKDIENLYEHHVLHSLAIAKVFLFQDDAEILDVGTGGGFPGVPLAILFPQVQFLLIDGTLKKIKVVQDVIQQLGLQNVRAQQARAEELKKQRFDFVVTRAVATLPQLLTWCQRLAKEKHRHSLPNGLIALKGGNLKAEIKALPKGEYTESYPISGFFEEPYFEGKFVVYLQL
ncbi:MAG: 16S rRNA (guanine(527)-N(7))-methyltransferase RsmG [Saprospiraceae bacterium]|nr:MAG: 16S rRNA (guanine(527)-N(7))-methyltransferase RsmG [Saprospiraceae bacterium]